MEIQRAIDELKYQEVMRNNEADYQVNNLVIKLAISALEKQMQKKAKQLRYSPLYQAGWRYECPSCGNAIGENENDTADCTQKDDYCPSCGQAIDWNEND